MIRDCALNGAIPVEQAVRKRASSLPDLNDIQTVNFRHSSATSVYIIGACTAAFYYLK